MNSLILRIKKGLKQTRAYYNFYDHRYKRSDIFKIQKHFFKQFLNSCNLIFDVGANLGNKAFIFKDFAQKVVLFEPQKYCIEQLELRYRLNSSILIEPVALGAYVGIEKIYLSNNHTISSLSFDFITGIGKRIFPASNWNSFEEIEVNTLDNMIIKYGVPDFIKIDVEGYELQVLCGLNYTVPIVSFEFIPNETKKTYLCLLEIYNINNSYQFNYTIGEDLEFELPANMRYGDFIKHDGIRNARSFGDIYAFLNV